MAKIDLVVVAIGALVDETGKKLHGHVIACYVEQKTAFMFALRRPP